MAQFDEIMKEHKETGNRIEFCFEDRQQVKVGDKVWKRVRADGFGSKLRKVKCKVKMYVSYATQTNHGRRDMSLSGYAVLAEDGIHEVIRNGIKL